VTGQVQARDVLQTVPKHKVDLALLLKSIPCLEQVDKAAVERLLDRIEADFLLISFPVHSLGGRERGMSINYATRFDELIAGRCWSVKRFQFETELVFLVKT
jgi:16S rRNA (guanine(1405)-N(7))-methyltransferase